MDKIINVGIISIIILIIMGSGIVYMVYDNAEIVTFNQITYGHSEVGTIIADNNFNTYYLMPKVYFKFNTYGTGKYKITYHNTIVGKLLIDVEKIS
jgi:hypothetical protein